MTNGFRVFSKFQIIWVSFWKLVYLDDHFLRGKLGNGKLVWEEGHKRISFDFDLDWKAFCFVKQFDLLFFCLLHKAIFEFDVGWREVDPGTDLFPVHK